MIEARIGQLAILLGLLLAPAASAAEEFPLGILGARGRVEAGSPLLTIVSVEGDSPAAVAGLRPEDEILGLSGVAFTEHTANVDDGGVGPQKTLGEALDDVAALAEPERRLLLDVRRGAETMTLEVTLPSRPSVRSPEGRRALLANAAAQLLKTRASQGHWDSPVGLTGDRVLTAWAIVALLSLGNDEHKESLDRAVEWLRGPEDKAWIPEDPLQKGPDNLGNWAITSTVVALVEHRLATGDEHDEAVIARCSHALVARMSPNGLFGHDIEPGYAGMGFNVINTLSHLAWAMAAEVGSPLDEEAWAKSLDQIQRSIDPNGGVRYWTMEGTGTGDASLRTSSMALALAVTRRAPELSKRLGDYLANHPRRVREAHAVGSLGMMLTPSALWRHDPDAYRQFLSEWRWYLTLMQTHEGSLRYIGGKGNNGGDSYLGFDRIACVIAILILTPPDGRLRLQRRGRNASAK